MSKYNHAFSFAFSLTNDNPDGLTSPKELRQAILKHLANCDDDEVYENCGAPFDTFEED